MSRDKALFEECFSREYEYLYTFAYIRLLNREDAQDVVQETALRAFVNFNSLKNISCFKTWVTRILLNNIYKLKNKEKKYHQTKTEVSKDSIWLDKNELHFIELIDTLKDKEKNIMYLKYFLQYTDDEISRTLKIPVGTVKSKHSRSIAKLKKYLETEDS